MSQSQYGEDLLVYLRMLAGEPRPGQFLDVRWATPAGGMRRRFVSALRVEIAARLITSLAARTDVYVGVALRDGCSHGGRRAITGSHLLWVESDDPNAADRVCAFTHSPTATVVSGTPGHLHMYWRLQERTNSAQVEIANRRLALALAGDMASVDIARLLRPPATRNYKHDAPLPVRLIAYRDSARYGLAELTAALPDPRPPSTRRTGPALRAASRTTVDLKLLEIPPARYVRALADRDPNRAGKITCPFHDDRRPSLQLYPDGSFYCFGCRRGGTIYDFAAHLWLTGRSEGAQLRGQQFIAVRERLTESFGIDEAARS
jgi:hypothetical protein